jgi:flagellar biosynthesis GTPase FlhF
MASRGAGTTRGGETAGEPPAVAARLYALPPDEFVPAREALGRALAEARDPLAAAIRKLRRPVGLAWVLNRVAASEKELVETLVASGDRLRAAQQAALEGRGAGPLREAEVQVREAARALRLAAAPVLARGDHAAPAAVMAHLEVLVRALATAPDEVRRRFRRGVLEREPGVGGGALEAFAGPGSRGRRAARPAGAPDVRAETRADPRRRQREERARTRSEERERRRAEQARRREEAAAKAQAKGRARLAAQARRALAEAERRLEQHRAAFEAARERLEAARAGLDRAEAEARRCRDRAEELGGEAGG